MEQIFEWHRKRYPDMDIRDYLKLIHQSVFGPSHAMREPSDHQVMKYLEDELKTFQRYEETPSYEAIGNGYFRVSLDVITQGGVLKERLCEAFLKSMQRPLENRANLEKAIEDAIRHLLEWMRPWMHKKTYEEALEFIAWYRKERYPAIHHSAFYRLHYHPHYRVIHSDFIPTLKGEHQT